MGKSSQKNKNKIPNPSEQTINLTGEQVNEFLRIVHDDLIFLRSLDYNEPSRTTARVASSILRRLLYDGLYRLAWQLAGMEREPAVLAVDLAAMLNEVEPRYIQYAYAGGAPTKGAQHKGYILLAIPLAEVGVESHEIVARRIQNQLRPVERRFFSLSQFCESPSVISGNAAVSRLTLVRYVANKLGGVHWDNQRGRWTDPVGSRHRLLDEEHIFVGVLPGALFEIVSIAHAIASSQSTDELIQRINTVAPEKERTSNILSFREGRVGKYADMAFGGIAANE